MQVLLRRLSLPAPYAPKPSPQQIQKFEESLKLIRELPADQQKSIAQNLDHFFELKPEEKTKVLGALSETERKEMEKSLQMFASLPKDQRDQCIGTFKKLAGLTPDERRQFLENAGRWLAMFPAERQTWRDLVHKLPSSPSGFILPPPPNPPGLPVPVVLTNKRA